jgi:hypothetical protein
MTCRNHPKRRAGSAMSSSPKPVSAKNQGGVGFEQEDMAHQLRTVGMRMVRQLR